MAAVASTPLSRRWRHARIALCRAIGCLTLLFSLSAGSLRADSRTIDAVVTGELPFPLAAVRTVLLDLERFGDWFPTVTQWDVLARSEHSARVYGRHSAPWPYRDRDYVVDYRWQTIAEGGFQLDATASTGDSRADEDVVRIEVLHSRWTLTSAGDLTTVGYEISTVPPTRSPRWLEGAAQRRAGEQLVAALGRELARRMLHCNLQRGGG